MKKHGLPLPKSAGDLLPNQQTVKHLVGQRFVDRLLEGEVERTKVYMMDMAFALRSNSVHKRKAIHGQRPVVTQAQVRERGPPWHQH